MAWEGHCVCLGAFVIIKKLIGKLIKIRLDQEKLVELGSSWRSLAAEGSRKKFLKDDPWVIYFGKSLANWLSCHFYLMIERFWVIPLLLKTEESWDFAPSATSLPSQSPFPCGPVAETPGSQCRGPRDWSDYRRTKSHKLQLGSHAVARRLSTA